MNESLTAGVWFVVFAGIAGPALSQRSLPTREAKSRCASSASVPGLTTRESVDSAGLESDGMSQGPEISSNGRFVAFTSDASNLVSGDENHASDVFVRDRASGTTERVSVDPAGEDAIIWGSVLTSISPDGRFVVFSSRANNLVRADTNRSSDVFVRDRTAGITRRVSITSTGAEADGHSGRGSISADGRLVSFESYATNLVPVDNYEYLEDVFVHDLSTGTTRLVSVNSAGEHADSDCTIQSISSDGRFVVYMSLATNLVAGDTNDTTDVFVHDLRSGTTERVSVDSLGTEGDSYSYYPSISGDGRYVAFTSLATNLVAGDTNGVADVFVRDRWTGTTSRVSVSSTGAEGDGDSLLPSISPEGRHVAFASNASSLVPDDTNGTGDFFVHDRASGTTLRVSLTSTGTEGEGDDYFAGGPSISSKGLWVAFNSFAADLVPEDTNNDFDIFVHRLY